MYENAVTLKIRRIFLLPFFSKRLTNRWGFFMSMSVSMRSALQTYKTRVSILKKGYAQEVFRIKQLEGSLLGDMAIDKVTSVDIATYRDQRLASLNPKTQRQISPATVRLEMSLLSNLFELAITEWGYCDENPVKKVRKPKPSPGRDRRLTAREKRLILRYCHSHPNTELYSIVVLALETFSQHCKRCSKPTSLSAAPSPERINLMRCA